MDVSATLGLCRSLRIYYGRPWRAVQARRFYSRIVRPGDLAFDIGAHVGSRTRALRAAGARVVALEPHPMLHRVLKRVSGPGVVVLNCAAGSERGVADLHISSRHLTVSSLAPDWIADVGATSEFARVTWDRRGRVEVTTLDALVAEFGLPRFCKIDVEGFEGEVLRGLSHPVPCIAFEYIPQAIERANACIDRIASLGSYAFNFIPGEGFRFACQDWLSPPAAKEKLRRLCRSGQPGDVYARSEDTG